MIYLHFEMGRSKFIWGFECSACPHALDFKETLFCLLFLSVFVFLFFWSGFWRTRGNKHQKSGLIYVYFELACSKFIWGFEFSACLQARDFRETLFWLRFSSVSIFLVFWLGFWRLTWNKNRKTGLIYLHFEMGSSKFIWGFEFLACLQARDFKESLFWLQFWCVLVFLILWSGFWRTRWNKNQKKWIDSSLFWNGMF